MAWTDVLGALGGGNDSAQSTGGGLGSLMGGNDSSPLMEPNAQKPTIGGAVMGALGGSNATVNGEAIPENFSLGQVQNADGAASDPMEQARAERRENAKQHASFWDRRAKKSRKKKPQQTERPKSRTSNLNYQTRMGAESPAYTRAQQSARAVTNAPGRKQQVDHFGRPLGVATSGVYNQIADIRATQPQIQHDLGHETTIRGGQRGEPAADLNERQQRRHKQLADASAALMWGYQSV